MHREAIRWPAQPPAEHRHRRRVGPEVGVQVTGAAGRQPTQEHTRLGQVDQVNQQAAVRLPPDPHRQPERPREADRTGHRRPEQGPQQTKRPDAQHRPGPTALRLVVLVHQHARPGPEGEPRHGRPGVFQRCDLAPDKRLARLRVLIDQVSDHRFQKSIPRGFRALRRAMPDSPRYGPARCDEHDITIITTRCANDTSASGRKSSALVTSIGPVCHCGMPPALPSPLLPRRQNPGPAA